MVIFKCFSLKVRSCLSGHALVLGESHCFKSRGRSTGLCSLSFSPPGSSASISPLWASVSHSSVREQVSLVLEFPSMPPFPSGLHPAGQCGVCGMPTGPHRPGRCPSPVPLAGSVHVLRLGHRVRRLLRSVFGEDLRGRWERLGAPGEALEGAGGGGGHGAWQHQAEEDWSGEHSSRSNT